MKLGLITAAVLLLLCLAVTPVSAYYINYASNLVDALNCWAVEGSGDNAYLNAAGEVVLKQSVTLNDTLIFNLDSAEEIKLITEEGATVYINRSSSLNESMIDILEGKLNLTSNSTQAGHLILDGQKKTDANSIIKIRLSGTLNMTDGVTLTNNTIRNNYGLGGGVVVEGGTFNMFGGEISGNTADYGGGVAVLGEFNMLGGEISGNVADYGSGVAVDGEFNMEGSATVNENNDVMLYGSEGASTNISTGVGFSGEAKNITWFIQGTSVPYNKAVIVRGGTGNLDKFGLHPSYFTGFKLVDDGTNLTLASITDITLNNEGTVIDTVNITYNTSSLNKTIQPPVTKTGHTFNGWSYGDTLIINETGKLVPDVEDYTNATGFWIYDQHTLDLEAAWEANVTSITLNKNGGTGGTGAVNITYGTASFNVTPIVNPTCANHIFTGWFNESAGGIEIINDIGYLMLNRAGYTDDTVWINTSRDITLFAQWKEAVNVTFNASSGIGNEYNQTIPKDEDTLLTPNTFTKSGYTFAGWNNTSVSGTEIDYPNEAVINITQDTTLYAVWTINHNPVPINSGGSSEDTGSGNYKIYESFITDGGYVSFRSSPYIAGVNLPEGSNGKVVLTLDSEKDWLKDDSSEYLFDIYVYELGDGTAEIKFKLSADKLAELKLNPADICLYHFVDGEWIKLETVYEVGEDGNIYYTSYTDSFSPFKIVVEMNSSTAKVKESVTPVETKETEAVPTYVEPTAPAGSAGAEKTASPMGVVGLISGLWVAVAVLRRK